MKRKSLKNIVKVTQKQQHVVVSGIGGVQGPQGVPGEAATIAVGQTTTLPAGSSATVTNTGTSSAAVFNFGVPEGHKGDKGDTGDSATIAVGSTSTLPAGSSATVTNTGTTSAAVFNFGIPKGDKGDKGDAGAGLQIDGSVATYADLPNDLGPDDAGKAYFVQADGKLYVWTGTAFPPDGQGAQFEGPQGPSGTISVGTTSTLPAGSSATVTNTGTSTSAIFNFGIPKGDKGDKGDPGISGTVGSSTTPVYVNDGQVTACNTFVAGSNWNMVPKVSGDGVMEIGRYIDFHNTSTSSVDNSCRIDNFDASKLLIGGAAGDLQLTNTGNPNFSLRDICTNGLKNGSDVLKVTAGQDSWSKDFDNIVFPRNFGAAVLVSEQGNIWANNPTGSTAATEHWYLVQEQFNANSNAYARQYCSEVNTFDGNYVWYRERHSGSWSAWQRIATDSDLSTIIGNLANLTTTDKTNVVSAINEVDSALDDAAYVGSVLSTPTDVDYVATNNIQDGAVTTDKIATAAVTSDKIDFTTLWTGDSCGQSITLSDAPANYDYLVFEFKSIANANAYGVCKIPVVSGARYTVSTLYMHQDGGIGMDCVQYIVDTNNAKNLNVRYQGQNAINYGGTVTTYNTTQIHVLKISGTSIPG